MLFLSLWCYSYRLFECDRVWAVTMTHVGISFAPFIITAFPSDECESPTKRARLRVLLETILQAGPPLPSAIPGHLRSSTPGNPPLPPVVSSYATSLFPAQLPLYPVPAGFPPTGLSSFVYSFPQAPLPFGNSFLFY
jgi:hypothetical protein